MGCCKLYTEPTYNLPFQNGKAQKEEESAKGSASKSSKESASLTTEVVPGRLFVSFILRYILIVHSISHFYISTLMNRPSPRSNPRQSQMVVMRKIMFLYLLQSQIQLRLQVCPLPPEDYHHLYNVTLRQFLVHPWILTGMHTRHNSLQTTVAHL